MAANRSPVSSTINGIDVHNSSRRPLGLFGYAFQRVAAIRMFSDDSQKLIQYRARCLS